VLLESSTVGRGRLVVGGALPTLLADCGAGREVEADRGGAGRLDPDPNSCSPTPTPAATNTAAAAMPVDTTTRCPGIQPRLATATPWVTTPPVAISPAFAAVSPATSASEPEPLS
jgi:hypothetical protein